VLSEPRHVGPRPHATSVAGLYSSSETGTIARHMTLARPMTMTLALYTLLDLLVTKAPPLKHPIPKSVLTGRTFGLTNVLTRRTNS
jgi:hypothetical protein